jgi:hypothetical protein
LRNIINDPISGSLQILTKSLDCSIYIELNIYGYTTLVKDLCIPCHYPNSVDNSAENSSTTEYSHLEKYDNGKLMSINSTRDVNLENGQHSLCWKKRWSDYEYYGSASNEITCNKVICWQQPIQISVLFQLEVMYLNNKQVIGSKNCLLLLL